MLNPLQQLKAHFEKPPEPHYGLPSWLRETKALVDAAVECAEKRDEELRDLCDAREADAVADAGHEEVVAYIAVYEIRALLEKGTD